MPMTRFAGPAIMALTFITSPFGQADVARCQAFAPYSDFQAMSPADLATLQVKLTYLGFQFRMVSTVLFGAPTAALDVNLFTPFHHPGHSYANDVAGQATFSASVSELKALIDSVGVLPGVTDGGVDSAAFVSFSLLNTAGTTKAFESIVDRTNGVGLFQQMLLALRNNPRAVRIVGGFGCHAHVLPATPPADVQNQVQVRSNGLHADRRMPTQFVGKVRITNTSGVTIQAPVMLIAILNTDANLLGNDGVTCNIEPPGHPFVNMLTSGGLAPGSTIERTLRFANPGGNKLNVSFKVFAGAGTP